MRKVRWTLRFALAAVFAVVGAGAAAAQQGSVTGTVTDVDGGTPLVGVRVGVVGTALIATTNQNGKYTITGVRDGARDLRAVYVGYERGRKSVTVVAGEAVTADFSMKALPYNLDEIVSTATGDQRKVEIGTLIGRIQGDSLIATAPVRSVADVLQGRVAGVTVLQSSGVTGGGSQVRIRGASSVSLSNEPLLYIDGVRVGNASGSNSIGVGGQSPSRLNDLNPEEIELIEVVKGPSAATLYGPDGANGVILVTTKRGKSGKAVWQTYVEQGRIVDPNQYPDNFQSFGRVTGTNAQTRSCFVFSQAAGDCTIDSVTTFNPLENPIITPINTGYRQQYGTNVSGGTDFARYFFSAEYEGESGLYKLPDSEIARLNTARGYAPGEFPEEILRPNNLRRISLRANAEGNIGTKTTVLASVGYGTSNLRLPQNDNNLLGMISAGLLGAGWVGDTSATGAVPGGWVSGRRPGDNASRRVLQDVDRFTGSLQATTTPFSALRVRAQAGYDITSRTDEQFQARGEFNPGDGAIVRSGFRDLFRPVTRQYTGSLDATLSTTPIKSVAFKTTGAVQFFKNSFVRTYSGGQNLLQGGRTLSGVGTQLSGETESSSATIGAFVEQSVGINDRLFLIGALRVDRASTLGTNFSPKFQPRASASYLMSDESWFPRGKLFSSLRLRAGYGEAVVLPGVLDAQQFFSPTQVNIAGADLPALVLGAPGNAGLRPETSKEFEGGFDASLFNDKVALEFTAYRKTTTDALLAAPLAPSLGLTGSRTVNLGSVKNEGLELSLNLRPITTKNAALDMTFTGSLLRNRLISLGGLPPIITGEQRAVEGTSLFGYWARPYTFNDANGDGQLSRAEVVIDTTLQFVGNRLPTRELALNTALTLFGRVRIGTQIDYRGGNKLQNLTEEFREGSGLTLFNGEGVRNPNASLERQARAVALRPASGPLSRFGFIEDASFVRWRELSVTYTASKKLASVFGGSTASITGAVRNLGLISNYTGVDPEVNGNGQGTNNFRDFLTQPQTRTFIVRANVGF
jgi:TonB-linked SusC/RagA family outer membrane protein